MPLDWQQLSHHCDPDQFTFQTTADLEDLSEIIGQARAMDAVRFGSGIRHEGYNLFVLGPSGMGKRSLVRQLLEEKAHQETKPADWCYINNFFYLHKPRVLKLPHGRGEALRLDMEALINFLRGAVPALFDSDEYRSRARAIQKEFNEQQEQALLELRTDAEKQEIVLLQTPDGFVFSPIRNHEVITPDEYDKLPQAEKNQTEQLIAEFQERLENILSHLPQWRRERSERIRQLSREMMLSTVEHMLNELRRIYSELPDVLVYFDAVQQDLVEHVDDFRKQEESVSVSGMTITTRQTFHSYQKNCRADQWSCCD